MAKSKTPHEGSTGNCLTRNQKITIFCSIFIPLTLFVLGIVYAYGSFENEAKAKPSLEKVLKVVKDKIKDSSFSKIEGVKLKTKFDSFSKTLQRIETTQNSGFKAINERLDKINKSNINLEFEQKKMKWQIKKGFGRKR